MSFHSRYYNPNYDAPHIDPFTQGRYTFYRARDVNASPMFRPLEYDTVYPRSWSFTPAKSQHQFYCESKHDEDFYRVPICRQ